MEVYDNPKYYEIAFSFRDIPAEVDFVEEVIKKYSGVSVKTILEIASGNSPHLQELCSRGYWYIGFESNDEMIAYTRAKIEQHSYNAKILKGNLVNFSISEVVDCALLFLGSLYVKSDADLKSHLNSLSKTLNPGGLYFLDGAIEFFPEDIRKQSWDMEQSGIKVTTTYDPHWRNEREKILEGKITLEVEDGAEKKKIEHSELRKIYSDEEFIQIVEGTRNWEYVNSFSNFDVSSKPQPGARNISVLRRK